MIDYVYLRLKGWEAFLFKIDGTEAYVMSNSHLNVIINQRGILRNASVNLDLSVNIGYRDYVSRVEYCEVWPYLLQEVYKFDQNTLTTIDTV